ncbi:MAG: hypothetical protein U1F26_17625 [Lysobacterales bacterium]
MAIEIKAFQSGFIAPKYKTCPATPKDAPPLAQIRNKKAPAGGLGVQLNHEWILTCEHVISNGARDVCDPLTDGKTESFEIKGACAQGETNLVSPQHFASQFSSQGSGNSPLNERLALVKTVATGLSAKIRLRPADQIGGGFVLWASSGSRVAGLACMVASLNFNSLAQYLGNSSYISEEFDGEGELVQGDSGGGFFAEERGQNSLCAIQNAYGTTTSGGIVAIAIPITERDIQWINDAMQKNQ